MWQVIKAEFKYRWMNFALFSASVPVLLLLQLHYQDASIGFLSFILLVLMINNWNAFQIREKRDFQHIQLPLPVRRLGLARILIVLISTTAFVGLFAVLHLVFRLGSPLNPRLLVTILAGVVLVFSLVFMFRDRFLGTKALMRGKMLIVAVLAAVLALNIATWVAIDHARKQGLEPPRASRLFEYIEHHNPASTNLSTLLFLVLSLVLACLTIETFARRRSQV
ncbi:MAG TPA: hypothetical protein VMU02_09460 [bacterium]|nr:hypothetical protein [bacterium]